ncbi:hypothetical protein BKA04_000644 [Cryobacterium mesophilum]|nr:hypothetical protein [Terrimesophilobacter mesophilus]MBB5632421.1 hypothetical protein [Terrimesophilobacter mesophilus]
MAVPVVAELGPAFADRFCSGAAREPYAKIIALGQRRSLARG